MLIGRKLEEILSWGELAPVVREDFESSLSMVREEKLSFRRFNDKLILSVAMRRKLPLLTFDMELRGEGTKRNVRIFPEKLK
jgi:hypothetical protein